MADDSQSFLVVTGGAGGIRCLRLEAVRTGDKDAMVHHTALFQGSGIEALRVVKISDDDVAVSSTATRYHGRTPSSVLRVRARDGRIISKVSTTNRGYTWGLEALKMSEDDEEASRLITGDCDGNVRVWDLGSSSSRFEQPCIASLPLPPRQTRVIRYAREWNHKVFLGAAGNAGLGPLVGVFAYDLEKCLRLHHLAGHTNWIYGIDFDVDLGVVVSCSSDTTARVYAKDTFESVAVLNCAAFGRSLCLAHDSHLLFAGLVDRQINVWDLRKTHKKLRTVSTLKEDNNAIARVDEHHYASSGMCYWRGDGIGKCQCLSCLVMWDSGDSTASAQSVENLTWCGLTGSIPNCSLGWSSFSKLRDLGCRQLLLG